jgi:microcystin-dependent protein
MHREAAYPIGSIYINADVATNPSDPAMLGFGTWTAFGSGRVMVGLDSGDADFNEAEETGGVKTQALSIANLAAHGHVQNSHNHTQNSHNHTQNSHNHTQDQHRHTALIYTGNNDYLSMNPGGSQYQMSWTAGTGLTNDIQTSLAGAVNQAATAVNQGATAVNQGATATNQNTGSGTAHNNVQPYIVVYLWKRTA